MKDFSSFFLKYKRVITITFLLLYGGIDSWIASVSKLADFHRTGLIISYWEPYCWEFSSFIITIFLILYIIKAESLHPLKYGYFKKNLSIHLVYSIIFSLIHVTAMVIIRKIVYLLMDRTYDFGHWPSELLYEYRKDILSYFFILAGIYIYQMILKQIQGDASLISEQNSQSKKTDKLLIKKKG